MKAVVALTASIAAADTPATPEAPATSGGSATPGGGSGDGGLRVEPLTGAAARELAAWRYTPPYDCYDFPPWREMVAQRWAITDPARHGEFRSVRQGPDLIGWYRLRRLGADVVLGCGLRPDSCGHGLGPALMRLVLCTAAEEFPGEPVRLAVRPFNVRAIRAYERAGFAIVARDDERMTMRRAPDTPG